MNRSKIHSDLFGPRKGFPSKTKAILRIELFDNYARGIAMDRWQRVWQCGRPGTKITMETYRTPHDDRGSQFPSVELLQPRSGVDGTSTENDSSSFSSSLCLVDAADTLDQVQPNSTVSMISSVLPSLCRMRQVIRRQKTSRRRCHCSEHHAHFREQQRIV